MDKLLDYENLTVNTLFVTFVTNNKTYKIYQHQRARWFKLLLDEKNKIYRWELVYVSKYIEHNGEKKKYVEVTRMNHKPWRSPLKLSKGLKSLDDAKSSIEISFDARDIECFLHWGMDTFIKHQVQVM